MLLTNKNTAIFQAESHFNISSKEYSHWSFTSKDLFGNLRDSWLRAEAQTWEDHTALANEIKENFLYRCKLQPSNSFYDLEFVAPNYRGYRNDFDISNHPTKTIELSKIIPQLKEDVQVFLYSEQENPYFWKIFISNFASRTTEVQKDSISKIKYLLVFKKSPKSNIDFENSVYSFFPLEFFNKIEEENQENLLDLDTDITLPEGSSISKCLDFFHYDSPITTGRYYKPRTKYSSSYSHLNALTDLKFFSENLEITRESLPVIEYNSLLRGSQLSTGSVKTVGKSSFKTSYKLIPFKSSSKIYAYNKKVDKFQNLDFYGFATYIQPNKIQKYKKAKNVFHEFYTKASMFNGEWFYDKELFQTKVAKLLKGHDKYSNNVISSYEVTETFSSVGYGNEINLAINDDINISAIAALTRNSDYKEYLQIKETYDDLNAKITHITSKINNHQRNKNRALRAIEDKKREIQRYEQYIETIQKGLISLEEEYSSSDSKNEKNISTLESNKKILEVIQPQVEAIHSQFISSMEETETLTPSKDKLLETFKKQGLHLIEILYSNTSTGEILDVNNSPGIILKAKKQYMVGDQNLFLKSIKFKLVKPVVVRVDPVEKGENCPKIAVGPLVIEIDQNNIRLKPLSTNCIIGVKDNTAWLHPHTSSFNLPSTYSDFLSTILNRQVQGCLGEASQALYGAFQNQDPRQAIMAAMTWVTSANSTDAWGRNWKHFPRASSITNLDQDIIEDNSGPLLEETLLSQDDILSNIFDEFEELEDSDSFQYLPSDPTSENISEDPVVEPSHPPQEQLNLAQEIRSPGIQGYVPFARPT